MEVCFIWLMLLVGGIVIVVTAIRWFEQTAEAVDNRWWNKVALLIVMPFAVWLFPSRVSAGRPMPVARHEPVQGFGMPPTKPPPKKKPGVDPAQVAKLREKMREQGMLDDDSN